MSADAGQRSAGLLLTAPYAAFLMVFSLGPIVAALVSWQLKSGGGFSQWYLGAGTAVLFYISLRGRPVWAWIGFVLLSAVIVVWGATTAVGAGTALLLAAKQFPILVVGIWLLTKATGVL